MVEEGSSSREWKAASSQVLRGGAVTLDCTASE